MTVTVTGKLNKSANKRDTNNGSMFMVNIGKQEYNRLTKEKEWVNYSAALFAKDGQAAFYDKALIQGCIVTVSGTGVLPRIWGDNKISLDLIDAKLEFAAQSGERAPPQQAQQQAPQQQAGGFDDFNDDIPF
jgi:hypothetical protein